MKKNIPVLAAAVFAVAICGCTKNPQNEKPQIDFYTNATCDVQICYDAAFSHTIAGGNFSRGEKTPCAGLENKTKVKYGVMSSDATISVSADFTPETEARFESLCEEVASVLTAVDNSLSITLPNSCVSRFNAAEAGARVEIDEITYEVLETAKAVHAFSEGYYNPSVYYSVQAYGFNGAANAGEERTLPDSSLTREYAALSAHFAEIELTEEGGKFYALKPAATVVAGGETLSLKLDLGGIGKGYATDIVNGLYDKYGFGYGYFDFGTSSKALKKFAGTGEYTLGIINPRGGGDLLRVKTFDACVSTSGDYQQYFIKDGVRYCHIIDPFTGEPTRSGVASVTIIGGSAAENDALTTAVLCMGVERGQKFVEEKLGDRIVVIAAER